MSVWGFIDCCLTGSSGIWICSVKEVSRPATYQLQLIHGYNLKRNWEDNDK